MNWLKTVFCLLPLSFLIGCVSDIPKPDYQLGDKSSLQAIRWAGVVKQDLDFSCGIASIATILKYHFGEEDVTEKKLLEDFFEKLSEEELGEVFEKGASLAQLGDLLLDKGFVIRNWELSIEELQKQTGAVPAIVYLETPHFRHFAVVRGVSEYQVWLADPARGNVKLTIDGFLTEWKGRRALLVAKNDKELLNLLLQKPDPQESEARAEMIRSIVIQPRIR